MKKSLIFYLFFLPLFTLNAQVNISGGCFTSSTELTSVGFFNGKEAFQGFGEVGSVPGLQINVFWDTSISPAAWTVLVSGDPKLRSTLDTTLPPDDLLGAWASTGNPPCDTDTENITISGPSTLPVELTSFEAEVQVRTVLLKWTTASETNNRGFEVQRSVDGVNWSSLDFVVGKGTASQAARYQFSDTPTTSGTFYYRLKQIDFDGQFEYSDVLTVSFRLAKKSIAIIENPIKEGMLQLSFDFDAINLRIVNQQGKTMMQYSGFSDKSLDVSPLGTGVYYLNIEAQGEIHSIKFLKL